MIKTKAKPNKKEITKEEAEKILKAHQKQDHDHSDEKNATAKKVIEKIDTVVPKNSKSKETTIKKVSKK